MKLTKINLFKYALMGIAGLAFAQSVRAATIFTEGFESVPVPSSPGYLYGTSGAWTSDSNPSNGNWWYDASYGSTSNRATPFGTIALHTLSSYKTATIGSTFVTGITYRMTARVATDTNNDAGRIFFYIGDDTMGGLTDGNSLGAGAFGTSNGASSVAANGGASNATDTADWEATGHVAGTWGTITLDYVATATDNGKGITIGVWGTGDSTIDDISIDTIPEPSTAALLGLGGLALIMRRRK
jgi:hypothetical protein